MGSCLPRLRGISPCRRMILDVSASTTTAPAEMQMAGLYQVLKVAQQAPAELVETLLSVDIQNQAALQKMEIAGQIIDTYA